MTAPLSSPQITEISALTTLEAQVAYASIQLQIKESANNATSGATIFSNVTVSPNFDNNSLAIEVNLPLKPTAAGTTLVAGVNSYLP